MNKKLNFNYANVPGISSLNVPKAQEFEEWHDLIDIRVPKIPDPSILLCPRVPMPLWGVNPRSILTQIDEGWWERTRKRVYEVNNQHCQCCGVHKSEQKGYRKYLDAHEFYSIDYKTGEMRLDKIVGLCSACHSYIHFGRLTSKYESGEISEKDFFTILSHGNSILQKAGLPSKNLDATINDNIYNIPWSEWRLILTIDGVEHSYYSKFKDEEDLKSNY